MKTWALAILATASPILVAQAAPLRMTVEPPHFTCEGRTGYASVAFHPGRTEAAALPCCDGRIGCAQFLSTDTVVHQAHQWRS